MPANKTGTNWYDEITDNAPVMNQNISVSGNAADRSRYFMSFDYFDQDAILIYSFYKRFTVKSIPNLMSRRISGSGRTSR